MIEPQSAQLGESALTLNETLVVAPRDALKALSPLPEPFPFTFPLRCVPFPLVAAAPTSTGRGVAAAGEEVPAAAGKGVRMGSMAEEAEMSALEVPAEAVADT